MRVGKEREREGEEDRRGATNAVRGGEFMYILTQQYQNVITLMNFVII